MKKNKKMCGYITCGQDYDLSIVDKLEFSKDSEIVFTEEGAKALRKLIETFNPDKP